MNEEYLILGAQKFPKAYAKAQTKSTKLHLNVKNVAKNVKRPIDQWVIAMQLE